VISIETKLLSIRLDLLRLISLLKLQQYIDAFYFQWLFLLNFQKYIDKKGFQLKSICFNSTEPTFFQPQKIY